MKRKIISGLVMLISSVAFIIIFQPSISGAASRNFVQIWSCGNGFPPCSSDTINICSPAPQPYLKMSSNQYNLTFTAPKAANYTCTITATASYFDYVSTPQNNEKIDTYLNNKKVGSTLDIWCPPGGKTIPLGEPDCTYSYLLDISMCEGKDNVETCNAAPNCCWMYGDDGCGGVGCCAGPGGYGSPGDYPLRICYHNEAVDKSFCLKNEKGSAWTTDYKCGNYQDEASCNNYNNHPGLVCCWVGSIHDPPCVADICPALYLSPVRGAQEQGYTLEEIEQLCEGTYPGSGYRERYPGVCEWDTGWSDQNEFNFPCACATNFQNTGRIDYPHDIGGPREDGTTPPPPPPTNHPPSKPDLSGSSSVCDSGVPCYFKAVSTDQDNDQIIYTFDWGDSYQTTAGPYQQGVQATESHTYPVSTSDQYYTVTVTAKDEHDAINSTTRTIKVYGQYY